MFNLRRHFYPPSTPSQETLKQLNSLEIENAHLGQELARSQSAMNSVSVGFIITNTESEIVSINRAAKKMLFLAEHSPRFKISAVEPSLAQLNCTLSDINAHLAGVLDLKAEIIKCLKEKRSIYIEDLIYKDLI